MRIAKIGKEINEKQRAALELGRGKDHWTQETYDKLNKIAKDRRGHMSNSKLKKEDIIEIIHEIIKGTKQGDIAKKFGVAPSRITRIKQEDAWGWLREEYPQLYKELDDFKLGETQ